MAGIPLGWTLSALLICAEDLRDGGYHGWGNFFDLARLLVFLAWARLAWRCSHNVEQSIWTPVARAILTGGPACMAMT